MESMNLDITSLQHQLSVLEDLVQNNTYNLGEAFFEQIVAKLNSALNADYTFIGKLDSGGKSVTTITLYGKGKLLDNFTYDLQFTPCENVIGNSVCCYTKNITNLFPKDQILIDMQIEGYVGVPTFNSNQEPTGIIVSLFENPIPNSQLVSNMLMLFAPRVGSEMEHKILQTKLQNHKDNLEQEVKKRTAELEESLNHLKETRSKLLQSEKLASLGVLTAGVAHEINNPLNYIYGGFSGIKSMLLNEIEYEKKDALTLLESIEIGVERIKDIVSGLNQFSRDSSSMDEECKPTHIIENCISILSNQLKNRIEVEKEYPKQEIKLIGNVGKMHQLFLNLLSNAVDAIAEKGRINIKVKETNKLVEIGISDNGHGIAEEHKNQVFDPFFTTKSPGKGTGLGLSIVHNIIKEHKATIEIDSEVGKGTTVNIYFPRID